MGHLISAGTGMSQFKNLAVEDPEMDDYTIEDAIEQLELAAQQAALEAEQEPEVDEAEAAAD
jgi:hypothetical protein